MWRVIGLRTWTGARSKDRQRRPRSSRLNTAGMWTAFYSFVCTRSPADLRLSTPFFSSAAWLVSVVVLAGADFAHAHTAFEGTRDGEEDIGLHSKQANRNTDLSSRV